MVTGASTFAVGSSPESIGGRTWMNDKLRVGFVRLLLFAGFVAGVTYVTRHVHDDLQVLCSFENQESLKETLKPDVYAVVGFSQGGQDYTGVRVDSHRVGLLLLHTRFFHQSAPYYIFDSNGRKVDFTRNYNDDHAFIHRWPGLFPTITSCKCGLK